MATETSIGEQGTLPLPIESRRCPHCAEEIQAEALRCRHCGRTTKPPLNRLAICALFGNLLGVPIGTVVAVACGQRAIKQIDNSNGQQRGRGLAVAGLVWGWGALALVGIVLLVILAANNPVEGGRSSSDPVDAKPDWTAIRADIGSTGLFMSEWAARSMPGASLGTRRVGSTPGEEASAHQ